MKLKVYIAGSVSADKNYKSKFSAAEESLRAAGFEPVSPAFMPFGWSNAEYLRICFGLIDACDLVALLPDWNRSAGARLEAAYCNYTKKPNYEITDIIDAGVLVHGGK